MDVLDEGVAKELLVAGVPENDRDDRQAGRLGGPQAPLPRDDFVAPVAGTSHGGGLQDAAPLDRGGEAREGLVGEVGLRLLRFRPDGVDRSLYDPADMIFPV